MANPIHPPDAPGDVSGTGPGNVPGFGQASSGTLIMELMMRLLKLALGDARYDKNTAQRAREAELRAKAEQLERANTSIEEAVDETEEKSDALRRAAVALLVLGIIGAAIVLRAGAFSGSHTALLGLHDDATIPPPHVDNADAGATGASPPVDIVPAVVAGASPSIDIVGAVAAGASPLPGGCLLNLASPPAAADIPLDGPIEFQWSNIPEAAAYSLEISPPAGKGAPWQISTTGTSKKIYMENFPAGGDYEVSLKAISSNGDRLCEAAFRFTKLAASPTEEPAPRDAGAPACNGPNCP